MTHRRPARFRGDEAARAVLPLTVCLGWFGGNGCVMIAPDVAPRPLPAT
jgi:hypothetical protein